ncbi:MAG: hypothetical protein SGI97_02295 [candidate division Zixibacteria bacterium]|nr:hypothetical protein [candidate division Zixibacteria bacterium]
MKSSTYFLWLRRLSPFILVAVLWFGYRLIGDQRTLSQNAERELFGLATAKVWIATAKYRDQPEKFLLYRDSLLSEMELSPEQMFDYIEKSEDDPDRMLLFTQVVKRLIDSLYSVQLSVLIKDSAVAKR